MWSLCPKISSSNREDSVRLFVGKEYTVGRKDCPILIKDDPSISRKHAVINIQHDVSNLGDPSKIPEVKLTDSSKYGILVNGVKVTQPTRLKSGDEILFGNHHSCYSLTYSPLVVVTSCLDNNKKKPLKKKIHLLGGHLLNEWKTGSVTHLVMDGLLFTIKVIHALAECCPIVTPNLFDEILKAAETTSSTFPMPRKFLPPLKEESIKSDGPLFLPDNARKTLFSGKTFIFLNRKQYNRTHEAIEMCGGKTILKDSITNNVEDMRIFVRDESCVMMVDQKERENCSLDMKQWITQIMDLMKSNNKRPIPESELGLAILKMSLTSYCNPDIDAVPALTQNIVCQSLNVGLDEMSQVFSPQHKAQASQKTFQEPINPVKEESEKDQDIMFMGTTLAKLSSTHTTAEVHHSSPEAVRGMRKIKHDSYKGVVSETQVNTPRSQKTIQNDKTSPIPDTLNMSRKGTTILAEETPLKDTKKSVSMASDVKIKMVIPDSEGFNASKTSAVPPETVNESPNGKTSKKVGKDEIKSGKSDVIPESMEMDGSFITWENRNSSHSSQEGKEESGWKPVKRMRVLDTTGEMENEKEVVPTKRARNDPVPGSPDQVFAEGLDDDEGIIEMIKEEEEYQTDEQQLFEAHQSQDTRTRTTSDSKSELQPEKRTNGFLSTKITGKQIKTLPKPEDDEDGLPRNLVVVDVVSLIIQKPKVKETGSTRVAGKNFKKFRKQWYAGCERRFPKIIGGSDLVVHQTTTGIEQEDWFIEAREANKEQDRRDRMEEELFMSDAGLNQGRKKRR